MTSISPELIKILKTKSSKKESSKFTYKLNALIQWINNDTDRQNLVGLRYKPPDRLEIKKQSLAATFQVQIDSLVLNFRRNGFTFLNKTDDWSIISIPESVSFDNMPNNYQFTNSEPIFNQPPKKNESKTRQALVIQPPPYNNPKSNLTNNSSSSLTSTFPTSSFNIVSKIDSSFITHLKSKWKVISDNRDITLMPIDLFLTRVSEVYQLKDITQTEAFHLFSLVSFCSIPGWFSFENFIILSTNFGEKNAILPKLVSLLQSNQKTGNWMRFKFKNSPKPKESTRVYFNSGASFGFIVVKPNGNKFFVYNDFNTPFFSDFLIDDKGNRYNCWDSNINH